MLRITRKSEKFAGNITLWSIIISIVFRNNCRFEDGVLHLIPFRFRIQYVSMAIMRPANVVVSCLQCHQELGLLLPGLLQRCRLAQVCFSI